MDTTRGRDGSRVVPPSRRRFDRSGRCPNRRAGSAWWGDAATAADGRCVRAALGPAFTFRSLRDQNEAELKLMDKLLHFL
jgi:hypothetical protein